MLTASPSPLDPNSDPFQHLPTPIIGVFNSFNTYQHLTPPLKFRTSTCMYMELAPQTTIINKLKGESIYRKWMKWIMDICWQLYSLLFFFHSKSFFFAEALFWNSPSKWNKFLLSNSFFFILSKKRRYSFPRFPLQKIWKLSLKKLGQNFLVWKRS